MTRSSMPTDHLTESAIAGFLDNDLPDSERADAELHLDACAECRRALLEVERIAASYKAPPLATAALAELPRRRRFWVPFGASAALAASIIFFWMSGEPGSTTSIVERADRAVSVDSKATLLPTTPNDDVVLRGESVAFAWSSAGANLYRLVIQDESGTPVLTHETADTVLLIPTHDTMVAGPLYFWRVDAITDGIIASSVVRKFRIAK
ncbi:MAG TPA: zf-HC2 domain-containing protein [Gemmatimonadaceae bacterium]|nr:zf-HC2 domain-containing protein [Gemmatimonadaceae bacterium]